MKNKINFFTLFSFFGLAQTGEIDMEDWITSPGSLELFVVIVFAVAVFIGMIKFFIGNIGKKTLKRNG